MSNKVVDKNSINSLFQLAINDSDHLIENNVSIDYVNEIYEEDKDGMIFKERRAEKSERRINDNHDYRGPARRLTIDRRK